MLISKIDGSQYNNLTGLSRHCYVNNITLLEYFIQYEKFIIPKCPYCINNCIYIKMNKKPIYTKTCENIICKNKIPKKQFKHTEQSKENLRQKRIEYLKKKTGKTAWERRSAGEMSYLEQWFYDNVVIKYDLCSKYDMITEYCEYPYFIDFAFINIKLAVELDGKCHFINNKRIEHDIKRDKCLIEKGWKVYRIKYDEANDNTIKEFLSFLDNIINVDNKVYGNNLYTYTNIKNENLIKNKLSIINNKLVDNNLSNFIINDTTITLTKINTLIYEEKQKEYVKNVLESNIRFDKYGWAEETSKIINQKPQKVVKWMKRFMPEFYNEKCFKRQTLTT